MPKSNPWKFFEFNFLFSFSLQTTQSSRAVASVNHLEIPAELAFVISKLDNWQPTNTEKNLAKVSGEVALPPGARGKKGQLKKEKLPHDIDYYVFSKVKNNTRRNISQF